MQYGDEIRFLAMLSAGDLGRDASHHWAFVPAARALLGTARTLGFEPTPHTTLQLVAALSAAWGLAASMLLVRCVGLPRRAALGAVLLLATTPAWLFFGRVGEVHALHFAAASTGLALIAACRLADPKARLPLTLVATALGCALLYPTHDSGLLLAPGFALLGAWVCGPELRLRHVVACAGAASLGLVAGMLFAAAQFELGLVEMITSNTTHVETDLRADRLRTFVGNVLVPYLALWPLVLLTLLRSRSKRRLALSAVVLLPMAFFSWWAVDERGAYLLGCAGATSALGAAALARLTPGRQALAVTALATLQLAFAIPQLTDRLTTPDDARNRARFATLGAAFAHDPAPKLVLTLDPSRQSPSARFWEVDEVALENPLQVAVESSFPVDRIEDVLFQSLDLGILVARMETQSLYLDRAYVQLELGPRAPYVAALEVALQRYFRVEELAAGQLWRLTPNPKLEALIKGRR